MTAPPDISLSELERDALTELVNIGVSRAGVSLRHMVGKQVLLSVPAIEIVTHRHAALLLGEREREELVAVRQDFAGPFHGRALLIFPQVNSLELVRAVMGEEMSASEALGLEQEALAETGNVILNGCLGSMANMLRQSLRMSLPEVWRGNSAALFEMDADAASDGLVLFMYINFFVLERNIRGYIAMLLDVPSMGTLKRLVRNFIATVMDDDVSVA